MEGIYFDAGIVRQAQMFASQLLLTKCTRSGRPEPLVLLPHSIKLVANLLGWLKSDGTRLYRKAYWSVARKNAKALALDTPIPTPSGWTTMGEIAEGDVVFSDDGMPCRVVATSDVFTDHECYEIEFSNGERIIADGGHLWLTEARVNMVGVRAGRAIAPRGETLRTKVRTTAEIYRTQTCGSRGDRNHSVRMGKPLELPQSDLPVEPYVLGVWLGDGDSDASYIWCGDRDLEDLSRLISSHGYDVEPKRERTCWRLFVKSIDVNLFGDRVAVAYASERNLNRRLRDLGVLGNKHIPDQYLRGSYDQRLSLLQGLMDTDGTINKNGRVLAFTTTSESFAVSVSELLASLGLKHSIRRDQLVCNGRIVPGTGYKLQFMAFRDETPVFRLPRKLARMRLRSECSVEPRSKTVQIKSVRKVETVPTKCIAVDAPSHMFLCGRSMIPTHNTQTLAFLALCLFFLDPEPEQEIYCAAKEREQAGLAYHAAVSMLRTNPDLQDLVLIKDSEKLIIHKETGSRLKALSSEGKSKHGFNPSMVIFDELHVWGSAEQELYDALTTGSAARREPLFIFITTAGTDEQSLCYREYDYARRVLTGQHADPTYLPLIWELPKDADWTDESLWHLANPAIDTIVRREELRSELHKALAMPSEQSKFRRLHLNQWVNAAEQWIPLIEWDRCRQDFEVAA